MNLHSNLDLTSFLYFRHALRLLRVPGFHLSYTSGTLDGSSACRIFIFLTLPARLTVPPRAGLSSFLHFRHAWRLLRVPHLLYFGRNCLGRRYIRNQRSKKLKREPLSWISLTTPVPLMIKASEISLRGFLFQQGYKDSNLEMTESESVALPFGDSPMSFT